MKLIIKPIIKVVVLRRHRTTQQWRKIQPKI